MPLPVSAILVHTELTSRQTLAEIDSKPVRQYVVDVLPVKSCRMCKICKSHSFQTGEDLPNEVLTCVLSKQYRLSTICRRTTAKQHGVSKKGSATFFTITPVRIVWLWHIRQQEIRQSKNSLFSHLTKIVSLHYLVKQKKNKKMGYFHSNAVAYFTRLLWMKDSLSMTRW